MTAPAYMQFPRGVAALQLRIGRDVVCAELYGPRQAGGHPQLFIATAAPADCWRTHSTMRGDLLPEKLWLGGTCVGLTRAEADQVDELLRDIMPAALSARAVA